MESFFAEDPDSENVSITVDQDHQSSDESDDQDDDHSHPSSETPKPESPPVSHAKYQMALLQLQHLQAQVDSMESSRIKVHEIPKPMRSTLSVDNLDSPKPFPVPPAEEDKSDEDNLICTGLRALRTVVQSGQLPTTQQSTAFEIIM